MLNFFKSIFSSKPNIQIESLDKIGVDIHSHLIANIDDGVKTIEEAIEIILFMKSIGYRKIITTPHTMLGGYDNTPEIIRDGHQKLLKTLKDKNIDFEVEVASEYYLDEHFLKLIKNEEEILNFGKNNVLFELSYMSRPTSMETTFFDLNVAGYRPILAHPERYPYIADKGMAEYEKIKDAGILFQINMFSLVGFYGKQAQHFAEQFIDREMVDYIGTDIHNRGQIEVLEACLKSEYLQKLINSNKLKNNTL